MFWIQIFKKLFKLLHSNIDPGQIAGGFALGSIIGLTPFLALHNLLVFIIIILLNVNIASAFFGIIIFGIIGFFTDPVAHHIGYYLLVKAESLTPFWTKLYNMPIIPFTRFNNTIVLGSLAIALILLIPIHIGTRKFIILYREKFAQKVQKWKIITMLKSTGIYKFYTRVKHLT